MCVIAWQNHSVGVDWISTLETYTYTVTMVLSRLYRTFKFLFGALVHRRGYVHLRNKHRRIAKVL